MAPIHQALSILLLIHTHTTWAHVAPLDRREMNKEDHPVLKARSVELNSFDYVPSNGPQNWFDVLGSKECVNGTSQSPIMLNSDVDQIPAGSLNYLANKTEGEMENKGSSIEITGAAGELKIADETFKLANLHFHTPSEHRLNKEHYPVEMHMVHQDASNQTAVVGFLVQLSTTQTSSFMRGALAKIKQVPTGQALGTGEMDFNEIVGQVRTQSFYQYMGSLTVPPCTESIRWLVATKPLLLDVDSYNNLKAAVKFNSRITQQH